MNSIESDNRYPSFKLSASAINYIRLRSPFMTMWWSFAFPGFGQWFQGRYFYGLVLIGWEFFINVKAHLNEAIYWSMIGHADRAMEVLDERWFLLYIAIYLFAVWDSFHIGLELNHRTMVDAQQPPTSFPTLLIGGFNISVIYHRNPWLTIAWSALFPGLGHFFLQRQFLAIFMTFWWIVSCYYSHIPEAVIMFVSGDIAGSVRCVDPEWLLFMPSLYMFSAHDTYLSGREMNWYYMEDQAAKWAKRQEHSQFTLIPAKEGRL